MRCIALCLLLFSPLAAAELTLAIEPRWHGAGMPVPSTGSLTTGNIPLRITRLSVLLSGVSLLRADGQLVRLDGQYGYLEGEASRLEWTLTGVPEGEYVELEFQIGVPETINHGDPGQWPAGAALNPLVNSMHWSWQGGYVFFAVEGRWQQQAGDGDSPRQESGFSYHIATDARRTSLRFRSNFSVRQRTTVGLALELSRVVDAARLGQEEGNESTHSAQGDELATRLAAALARSWFWLEAKESPLSTPLLTPQNASAPAQGAMAFVVPAGFPQPDLPADNPLTKAGVSLGEILFHDPRLSGNGAQSCATCHNPDHAFSDTVALSRGADGAEGRRNSMPLVNLAWNPAYAWDGSQPRIRDQALAAMTNPIEMHADPIRVTDGLQKDEAMADRFAAAFGSAEISAERVSRALEQYLLTLVSADSKLDRVMAGRAQLTEQEQRGFELFLTEYDPAHGRRGADCFHCHGGALFTDYGYKSNGLGGAQTDEGRAAVTHQPLDRARFKTPSLRNVGLTAPYMHDGRFKTLKDVVAHYDHGVSRTAALDPNLAKHPMNGLALSAADQDALVAFLLTLTEEKWTDAPSSSSK